MTEAMYKRMDKANARKNYKSSNKTGRQSASRATWSYWRCGEILLKSAASVVGFVADNLWTLILAIGGLLYYELKPALTSALSKTSAKTSKSKSGKSRQ